MFGAWQLTLERVRKRALLTSTVESLQARGGGGPPLAKVLGTFDLLLLGIGSIIGAGAFVITGVAAQLAGPAVALSYTIAAVAALLSGLCYVEFVVDIPIAGGAFNYIQIVFGELAAWVVASNLVLEYTLSAAAVGRSASAYFATLLGLYPTALLIPLGPIELDLVSLALVLLLSALLAHGTAASSTFNNGMNLIVIMYVLAAGPSYANVDNLSPFAPSGAHPVFAAASIVFFSFVGFDAVCTAGEEAIQPEKGMPIGIVGAILISGLLYVLMCLSLCTMVPISRVDINAPFAAAFTSQIAPYSSKAQRVFLGTSARFISFGALTGIVTSLLVTLLGQARIYVVLGREQLLPAWLADIHPTRLTPEKATWLAGISSGVLACFVKLDTLAELVSIGTLFVFFMVAAAVLWRRYHSNDDGPPYILGALMTANIALALSFSAAFTFRAPVAAVGALGATWLVSACAFWALPVRYVPPGFAVPLSPFTPALTMLATLHLIGSLGWLSYARFGVWFLLCLLTYMLYGVHRAAEAAEKQEAADRGESAEDVPLYDRGTSMPGVQLELSAVLDSDEGIKDASP